MQKQRPATYRRNLYVANIIVLLALMCGASALGQTFSPWSQAVNIGPPVSTTGYQEGCPFISKSNLDLYFRAYGRPGGQGGWDVWVSHRESADDPWEPPINLGPKINTSGDELCSFVTNDGHWLYFVSTRPGGIGGFDLWVSHRKDKRDDAGWEEPINLGPNVNSSLHENGPYLFEDESTGRTLLYFSSNRPGGAGNFDIYVSESENGDKRVFGPAVPVVELNSASDDMVPFLSRKGGLEVVFLSSRPGGSGNWDLWGATRPTTTAPWSTPVNLGNLINSTGNEARPSISWDGTALYFWTDRDGGNMNIYRATRTKLHD